MAKVFIGRRFAAAYFMRFLRVDDRWYVCLGKRQAYVVMGWKHHVDLVVMNFARKLTKEVRAIGFWDIDKLVVEQLRMTEFIAAGNQFNAFGVPQCPMDFQADFRGRRKD